MFVTPRRRAEISAASADAWRAASRLKAISRDFAVSVRESDDAYITIAPISPRGPPQ